MPRSTAASVMRASSPAFKPPILTGTVSVVPDLIFSGAPSSTFKRVGGLVETQPLHADGAARHPLQALVQRTVEHGGDVGAGAPVVAHRHVGFAAAVGDVDFLLRQQAVRQHRDQRLAALLGGDAQLGGLARLVAGAVERDVEHFRALGFAGGRVPAGIEGGAGGRTARIGRGDLELVASVVDAGFDPRQGAVGGGVQGAVGDLTSQCDGLVVPLAVAAIPLPVAVEAVEHPVQPVGGNALAFGIERDDFEAKPSASRRGRCP